jgi:hypothetical protein
MNDKTSIRLIRTYTFTISILINNHVTFIKALLCYFTLSYFYLIVHLGLVFNLPFNINKTKILKIKLFFFAGALKEVAAADVCTWRDFHLGLKHDPG